MDANPNSSHLQLRDHHFQDLLQELDEVIGLNAVPDILKDNKENTELFRNVVADAVGDLYDASNYTHFDMLSRGAQIAKLADALEKSKIMYRDRCVSFEFNNGPLHSLRLTN